VSPGLPRGTYTDPVAAAEVVAEGVRALNHATLVDGYGDASDLDSVLGSLATLAERLPQALTQALMWVQRAQEAGGIGHDHGESVAAAVTEVVLGLTEATRHAAALAAALNTTRRTSTHLCGGVS
jgi:hypothetical protein